jgi:methylated-DNA-[protein]-cysteine S-methyltransferase
MAQALLPTPLGPVLISAGGEWLTSLIIAPLSSFDDEQEDSHRPLLREAQAQLSAYFDGRLSRFDLPLAPLATPRGEAHRDAIVAIGFGDRASYGAVARQLGSSPRAVGQACRRNPFPIIVPCHRVIGAGGAIGHYSGGKGIATKVWLLDHELRNRKGKPDGFHD